MRNKSDGVKRTACPVCGGKIAVSVLYQYSLDYTVTKSGKLSKNYTKNDCGPMEAAIAYCKDCDERWAMDEFEIDKSEKFVDLKERSGEDAP